MAERRASALIVPFVLLHNDVLVIRKADVKKLLAKLNINISRPLDKPYVQECNVDGNGDLLQLAVLDNFFADFQQSISWDETLGMVRATIAESIASDQSALGPSRMQPVCNQQNFAKLQRRCDTLSRKLRTSNQTVRRLGEVIKRKIGKLRTCSRLIRTCSPEVRSRLIRSCFPQLVSFVLNGTHQNIHFQK